jgi:hypothetical protein
MSAACNPADTPPHPDMDQGRRSGEEAIKVVNMGIEGGWLSHV